MRINGEYWAKGLATLASELNTDLGFIFYHIQNLHSPVKLNSFFCLETKEPNLPAKHGLPGRQEFKADDFSPKIQILPARDAGRALGDVYSSDDSNSSDE
jgi:hypothetical protein